VIIEAVNTAAKDAARNLSAAQSARALVLPFAGAHRRDSSSAQAPYSTTLHAALADAGVTGAMSMQGSASAGLLGVLPLPSGPAAALVTGIRPAGALPGGHVVYSICNVQLQPLHTNELGDDDRQAGEAVVNLLESGHVLVSYNVDLTRSLQKQLGASERKQRTGSGFWWTWPMAAALNDDRLALSWSVRTALGFVSTSHMTLHGAIAGGGGNIWYTLISRRSRLRAGVRFITRGADTDGNVANFVETEQIVWLAVGAEALGANALTEEKRMSDATNGSRDSVFSSFRIIRGSIPVLWKQNNGLAKPPPELETPMWASRAAFRAHMAHVTRSYRQVVCVSLVNLHGSEGVLADAFQRHLALDSPRDCVDSQSEDCLVRLIAFDFHEHCAGKEYERGLTSLMTLLKKDIHKFGVFVSSNDDCTAEHGVNTQRGVFRVNCVDCLDRTNVVQSAVARVALGMQLYALQIARQSKVNSGGEQFDEIRLSLDSEESFKRIWADNADAISKQYAGTGAMKTDMTRTGKRSAKGMLADGVKSAVRVYYKNVVDEARQEAINLITGCAMAARIPRSTALFVAHTVQRVSPGGEREAVVLELHENAMYVLTAEGLRYAYARDGEKALHAWHRRNDREKRPRLRLDFGAASISPLELQFRDGGSALRERFLRSLLAWTRSPVVEKAAQASSSPFRVRVLAAAVEIDTPHFLRNWGLASESQSNEDANGQSSNERLVICLVVPRIGPRARLYELAAVPADIDAHGFVLLSAQSAGPRGPAMCLLVTKDIARYALEVTDSRSIPNAAPSGSAPNAMVATAVRVLGVSLCFIGMSLYRPDALYTTLAALRLGRPGFDAFGQYERTYLCGRTRAEPATAEENHLTLPDWKPFADGVSTVRNFANGVTAVRSALPNVPGRDLSASAGSSALAFAVDELLPSRPLPSLPSGDDPALRATMALSRLQISNLRIPPAQAVGVGYSSAPSNCYIQFHSNLMFDVESTRVSLDGGPSQRWVDTQRLQFVASRKEELLSSLVFGLVIQQSNSVFPEQIVIGSFALPLRSGYDRDLSAGPESDAGFAPFEAQIRMQGANVGTLRGETRLTLQPRAATEAGLDQCISGDSSGSGFVDPKLKQTNSRKVKNYIGKISNYWSKAGKADTTFARPSLPVTSNDAAGSNQPKEQPWSSAPQSAIAVSQTPAPDSLQPQLYTSNNAMNPDNLDVSVTDLIGELSVGAQSEPHSVAAPPPNDVPRDEVDPLAALFGDSITSGVENTTARKAASKHGTGQHDPLIDLW